MCIVIITFLNLSIFYHPGLNPLDNVLGFIDGCHSWHAMAMAMAWYMFGTCMVYVQNIF